MKTIKVPDINDNGESTGNFIHYACDPNENGEHMYIGFLTRSTNPFGQCMPCCFKKDPSISNNKAKRDFFNNCLGKGSAMTKDIGLQKTVGDKLYILQDTNKIQEGRFGFLPKYLDRYFNYMLDKNKKIKHHYLEETKSGYFFKYGSNQAEYQFLSAISAVLEVNIDDIKTKIINKLIMDKNDQIFTSLNAGDIKTQFGNKDAYIQFINTSNYLDFLMTKDIISIPGVLMDNGINLIVFHKKEIRIKRTLEKERIIEDFYLDCTDPENYYQIKNPDRTNIILIRDNKNYYPIVMVKKDDKNTKSVITEKLFYYDDNNGNIVNHISDFFIKNCSGTFIDFSINKNESINAKKTAHILKNIDKQYHPKYQIIDIRNKCKYIITQNGILIPVRPSGSLWDVQIIKNFDKYIYEFDKTYKSLIDIYNKTKKQVPVKPIGIYYESINNDVYNINSIMTKTKDVVPIKPLELHHEEIEKLKFIYEKKPLTDNIDEEIYKGQNNYKIDERIIKINENMFIEEGYQLFRLEFSNYINKQENQNFKTKLAKIMNSTISKNDKTNKIRLLIYKIIDKQLYEKYLELVKSNVNTNVNTNVNNEDFQIGGRMNKLIHITSKIPNIINYHINNERNLCETHKDKNECSKDSHCKWSHDACYLGLTIDMVVMYVNRISDELAQNDLKAFEVMKIGNYFVSDIVDRDRFTYVPGQKIIRATSSNIKRTLQELFGRDNIPNIGKRKAAKINDVNYHDLNIRNPMIDLKDIFVQKIIPNNITIFRAYANGYHWIKNNYYDYEARNIGYYSPLQSDLATIFKSKVIEWLSDPHRISNNKSLKISQDIINGMDVRKSSKDPIREYINRLSQEIVTLSKGIAELIILSKINNDIAIIIRNESNKITDIMDSGKHIKNPTSESIHAYDFKKCINFKYEYVANSTIPDIIEVIYYKDS